MFTAHQVKDNPLIQLSVNYNGSSSSISHIDLGKCRSSENTCGQNISINKKKNPLIGNHHLLTEYLRKYSFYLIIPTSTKERNGQQKLYKLEIEFYTQSSVQSLTNVN